MRDARYNLTKLGSVPLARSIARLLPAKDVVVNSVNPGLCASEFRREYTGIGGWLLDKLAWPTEKGVRSVSRWRVLSVGGAKIKWTCSRANVLVEWEQIGWAATEDTPAGVYVDSAAVRQPSVFVRSDEGLKFETELWTEMTSEWNKVAPAVQAVLSRS